MKFSNRQFKLILKIIGPILLLFFLFQIVDLSNTINILKKTNIPIFLCSMFFFPIMIWVCSMRWWIICKKININTSIWTLFKIYYISWFLSLIPPGGVGAVSKIIYLKNEGNPYGQSVLSLSLDKIFDVGGLFIFGVFGLFYFPLNFFNAENKMNICIVFILVPSFLFLLRKQIWKNLKYFSKRYSSKRFYNFSVDLERNLSQFWQSFSPLDFFFILISSIIIGLLRATTLFLLAYSLNIKTSFIFIIACRSLIGIINMIPITFNGIGTRDAILLATFPLEGLTNEMAISLGLLAFVWAFFFKISGIFFWLRSPLSYKKLNFRDSAEQ